MPPVTVRAQSKCTLFIHEVLAMSKKAVSLSDYNTREQRYVDPDEVKLICSLDGGSTKLTMIDGSTMVVVGCSGYVLEKLGMLNDDEV